MTMLGRRHAPESIEKMRAAKAGKKLSEDHRRKISDGLTGKTLPAEVRQKIGDAHRGKTISAEQRAKLSEALSGENNPSWAKPKSAETIAKIRAALMAHPVTDEARAKMSAARMGKPFTPEARAKLIGRASPNKGKTVSAEQRAKISASRKGKCCGPEAPNWKGGISFEPYCIKFNREFKNRVREFFGRRCAECGSDGNGKQLDVHHVNFRKDACCNDQVIPLFVPLCRSCHMKTNTDRGYWEERLTVLINGQYGGHCYLPKPEATPPDAQPA